MGRIAVLGATGTVGRHVVAVAAENGHEVVAVSRSAGIDLLGPGLAEALAGVDAVIDVSHKLLTRRAAATEWFTAATTNVLAACERTGVRHLVTLSIVGIDQVDDGYYSGKLDQERLVAASEVPSTILRATQFHEFAGQIADRSSVGPLVVVPRMPVQPVAAADVSAALVETAEAEPMGRATDLAGPAAHRLVELVRRLRSAQDRAGLVTEVPIPTRWGRAVAAGALLPGPDAAFTELGFDAWLAAEEPAS